MADQTALFGVVVGIALLLSGLRLCDPGDRWRAAQPRLRTALAQEARERWRRTGCSCRRVEPPRLSLLATMVGRQSAAHHVALNADRPPRGVHRARPCMYLQRPRSCPPAPTRRTTRLLPPKLLNSFARNQPTHHRGKVSSDGHRPTGRAINACLPPFVCSAPARVSAQHRCGRYQLARLRAHPRNCLTKVPRLAGPDECLWPLGTDDKWASCAPNAQFPSNSERKCAFTQIRQKAVREPDQSALWISRHCRSVKRAAVGHGGPCELVGARYVETANNQQSGRLSWRGKGPFSSWPT